MPENGKSAILYGSVRWPIKHPSNACRVCGCTEDNACEGGCAWVIAPELGGGPGGICDACLERVEVLLDTPKARQSEFVLALSHEPNSNIVAWALHNATGDWRRSALKDHLRYLDNRRKVLDLLAQVQLSDREIEFVEGMDELCGSRVALTAKQQRYLDELWRRTLHGPPQQSPFGAGGGV
jgi:hypothetical protein